MLSAGEVLLYAYFARYCIETPFKYSEKYDLDFFIYGEYNDEKF